MCTAASFRQGGHFFGRTLDNTKSYGGRVVFSPRNAPLWRGGSNHYAMLGMATLAGSLPLYYDGVNEHGLCMAGLNFASSAGYSAPRGGALNLAQYELLPYILGTCANVEQAVRALSAINITQEAFSPKLPPAPLHWMICDALCDVVAECIGGHMHIHYNAAGVLTNEPPLPMQLANLNNYLSLTAGQVGNTFGPALGLQPFCCGLGAVGLPGDWSSMSRFVRAAFVRANYAPAAGQNGVHSLFNILASVQVPRGCCRARGGWQTTLYTCVIDGAARSYSYTTRHSAKVQTAAFGADLNGFKPVCV